MAETGAATIWFLHRMDNYHGKADKPGKRAKPTADELDAEMDAYNKAAAAPVAAEA